MSSEAETKTQLCGNCKKDIPSANFTIHEIHCKRNIDVCTICREPFPKSEMKNHNETEHIQVVCKCNMKMEKRHLEMHQMEECPLRPAQCQYCELELPHSKVSDHEDYCGSRTESCSTCGRNVMVKDLQAHPTICGQVTEEIQRNSERLLSRYSHRNNGETWFDSQATRNYLGEDYVRPPHRIPRQYQSRFYKNVVQSLEGNGRRQTHTMQVDQNLVDEQENVDRNLVTGLALPRVENSQSDYQLALSLQNENPLNQEEPATNRWKEFYSKDRSPSKYLPGHVVNYPFLRNFSIPENISTEPKSNDTMLPCEFCEELIPEEDLILHQLDYQNVKFVGVIQQFATRWQQENRNTLFSYFCARILPEEVESGCNTGNVLRSYSNRNPSPVHQHDYDDRLRTLFGQTSEALNNRFALLSEQLPVQTEENIMIPCEFCGIQLEDFDLYEHQRSCNSVNVLGSFLNQNPARVDQPDYSDQLRTLLDQTSNPLNTRFSFLDQIPVQTEDSVIIPCEFCGIQLEDDNLFQHQDQCDLRPSTAASTTRPWEAPVLLPKKDNVEKNDPLPLHPRRVRHQADLTPSLLLRNETAFVIPSEEIATTRTVQHKPSNNSANRERLHSRVNNKNAVGRTVSVSNLGKPSAVQPCAVRSTLNHQLENGVQDLPGGSPTRPSSSWGADFSTFPTTRNNAVHARRNIKVKHQKPSDGDVEKEE